MGFTQTITCIVVFHLQNEVIYNINSPGNGCRLVVFPLQNEVIYNSCAQHSMRRLVVFHLQNEVIYNYGHV